MDRSIVVTYHIQQGSSSTLRVTDGNAWYVVAETWEGSQLLGSRIKGRYSSRQAALTALKKFKKE